MDDAVAIERERVGDGTGVPSSRRNLSRRRSRGGFIGQRRLNVVDRQGRILLADRLMRITGLGEGADARDRDPRSGDDRLVLDDAALPLDLADRFGPPDASRRPPSECFQS